MPIALSNTLVDTRYMQRKANGQFSSRDFTGFWLLTTSILIGALLKYTPKAQAEAELANPYVSHDFNASPSAGLWREAEIVPLDQLSERLNTGSKTVEQPKTGKEQIVAYIYEVFGKDADNAIKVLECENRGLKENAINHNRNGSTDHGIFQINSIHLKGKAKGKDLNNYRDNIDVAKKIFDDRGWTAWTCSYKVGVKSFWQ